MIELLGVGLSSPDGQWLLRRVCVRLETAGITFVVSDDRDARLALLDVLTARRVATEGRAWLGGKPVMHETATGIAARIGEVDPHGSFVDTQSVLWNLLAPSPWGRRAWRALFGRGGSERRDLALRTLQSIGLGAHADEPVGRLDEWRRRRLSIARAMMRQPEHLVVREVDDELPLAQAADLLGALRTVSRSDRISVIASAADPMLRYLFADRVLTLSAGALTLDASADPVDQSSHRRREFAQAS